MKHVEGWKGSGKSREGIGDLRSIGKKGLTEILNVQDEDRQTDRQIERTQDWKTGLKPAGGH